jgi:hypothetical protein
MSPAGKRCPKCRLSKPFEDFYKRAKPHRGSSYSAYCKPCSRLYDSWRKSDLVNTPELAMALEAFDIACVDLGMRLSVLRESMQELVYATAESQGLVKREKTKRGDT